MTTDLRQESMRDFHASEGNTFSDHALQCAIEGRVLLTKAQAGAIEDHLDCVGTSIDARLWGYCGRFYETDNGYIDYDEASGSFDMGYWLISSPFDPYSPAPDGSDNDYWDNDQDVGNAHDDSSYSDEELRQAYDKLESLAGKYGE